jgi:hypothetical protein
MPKHAIKGKKRPHPKLQVKEVARNNPPLSPLANSEMQQAANPIAGNEITAARL